MPHDAQRQSYLSQLRSDRRIGAMLALGFSSGIPILLVYSTQSVWLTKSGVPIDTIGRLSELTLAYKFKFVWAPFLERYDPPFLAGLLGRRRGWMVLSQLGVMLGLVGVAFGDPAHSLAWTVAFSIALGFAGATQDAVIDGWRINAAPQERQALMASWSEVGYRVGNFVAGGIALYLAAGFGWRAAYLCMVAAMTVGIGAALFAPEPEGDKEAARQGPPREKVSFASLVITPILELVTRLGPMAAPILIMVAGFRMPGYVSGAMANPLFASLHYSEGDIATVTKAFGFWLALGAAFFGAWLIRRIGMMASLVAGTVAGSTSHLALAWLAARGDTGGHDFWSFAIANGIDSFCYSFASIVLITYMSTLCLREMAASQFALLTSLVALPGSLLAFVSGSFIKQLGFETFFIATSLIGIPVAILCLWIWHREARRAPVSVF